MVMLMVVTRNIIISIIIIIMIVVTRNIDITFCRVFHTPPDFPDKIFTLVVVVVPLILGPPDNGSLGYSPTSPLSQSCW